MNDRIERIASAAWSSATPNTVTPFVRLISEASLRAVMRKHGVSFADVHLLAGGNEIEGPYRVSEFKPLPGAYSVTRID